MQCRQPCSLINTPKCFDTSTETCRNVNKTIGLSVLYYFDVLLTVHLSIFVLIDAQNFCFTISLFHASTCLEPTECDDTRGRIIQF